MNKFSAILLGTSGLFLNSCRQDIATNYVQPFYNENGKAQIPKANSNNAQVEVGANLSMDIKNPNEISKIGNTRLNFFSVNSLSENRDREGLKEFINRLEVLGINVAFFIECWAVCDFSSMEGVLKYEGWMIDEVVERVLLILSKKGIFDERFKSELCKVFGVECGKKTCAVCHFGGGIFRKRGGGYTPTNNFSRCIENVPEFFEFILKEFLGQYKEPFSCYAVARFRDMLLKHRMKHYRFTNLEYYVAQVLLTIPSMEQLSAEEIIKIMVDTKKKLLYLFNTEGEAINLENPLKRAVQEAAMDTCQSPIYSGWEEGKNIVPLHTFKAMFLQLLLHLNGDFDDDLLQDAVEILCDES